MDAESGIRSVDREGFGWSPWLSFDIHMQMFDSGVSLENRADVFRLFNWLFVTFLGFVTRARFYCVLMLIWLFKGFWVDGLEGFYTRSFSVQYDDFVVQDVLLTGKRFASHFFPLPVKSPLARF